MATRDLAALHRLEDWLFGCAVKAARSRARLRLRSLRVQGESIRYLERDGVGETIVLLHGYAASKDNWLLFARNTPAPYRLIIPDLPGHGDSDFRPDCGHDAASLSRRLAHIVEGLGLERAHFAGNSLGGWVATLFAAAHPERVATLGLFNAAGVFAPTPSDLQHMLARGRNPLLVERAEDFATLITMVFHKPPTIPWPAARALPRLYVRRRPQNARIWHDIVTHLVEVVDVLPQLTMPTLVLWGEHDRVLHVSSTQVFAKHLADPRVVVMEECGHSPMLEQPSRCARHYTEFLRASGRRAR